MPQTYTRTVAWTGANTGAGPNYTWEEVSNSSAGWVTYVQDSNNADAWLFQISDNTASNAVQRSATFRVKHWTFTDGTDANTFDEFTITQYTSGSVEVTQATAATTNATAATTLATNATQIYTVTYTIQPGGYSSNATGTNPNVVQVPEGTQITIAGPTWSLESPNFDDYTFIGYAEDSNPNVGTDYTVGQNYTVNGNVTFYGRYQEPIPTTGAPSPTPATSATTLATSATTLATQAKTNATIAQTEQTFGTSATTLATDATVSATIAWENATLDDASGNGGFFAEKVVKEGAGSGSGSGTGVAPVFNANPTMGIMGQTNQMYFGNSSGSTVTDMPAWISGVTPLSGGYGGNGNMSNKATVSIQLNAYPPSIIIDDEDETR